MITWQGVRYSGISRYHVNINTLVHLLAARSLETRVQYYWPRPDMTANNPDFSPCHSAVCTDQAGVGARFQNKCDKNCIRLASRLSHSPPCTCAIYNRKSLTLDDVGLVQSSAGHLHGVSRVAREEKTKVLVGETLDWT